jgi:hypothetical protein
MKSSVTWKVASTPFSGGRTKRSGACLEDRAERAFTKTASSLFQTHLRLVLIEQHLGFFVLETVLFFHLLDRAGGQVAGHLAAGAVGVDLAMDLALDRTEAVQRRGVDLEVFSDVGQLRLRLADLQLDADLLRILLLFLTPFGGKR